MTAHTAPAGNETIAVIEFLEGVAFVFDEAFIAGIEPHYNGVDLRTLIIDLASWYAAHPDKRVNPATLLKDLANHLGEWATLDKYQLAE